MGYIWADLIHDTFHVFYDFMFLCFWILNHVQTCITDFIQVKHKMWFSKLFFSEQQNRKLTSGWQAPKRKKETDAQPH